MTHVDTSFLVDLLREAARGEHGRAHAMLDELAEEPLAVSVFVACELHAGAELTKDPDGERGKIDGLLAALETVPPDEGFARRYGKTLAELRDAAGPSPPWTCSSPSRLSETRPRLLPAMSRTSRGCRGCW